jgi:hypothetical protein
MSRIEGKLYPVSKNNPCPICDKPDWCLIKDDNSIAICNRIENDKPTKDGSGFSYGLNDNLYGSRQKQQSKLIESFDE